MSNYYWMQSSIAFFGFLFKPNVVDYSTINVCLLLLVAEKFTTKAEIEPAVEISFMTCSIINASLTDFMNIHGE